MKPYLKVSVNNNNYQQLFGQFPCKFLTGEKTYLVLPIIQSSTNKQEKLHGENLQWTEPRGTATRWPYIV